MGRYLDDDEAQWDDELTPHSTPEEIINRYAHTASCPHHTEGLSPWCNCDEAAQEPVTSMFVLSDVFDDQDHARLTQFWNEWVKYRTVD